MVLFLSLLQAAPGAPADPAADLNRARLYLERDRFAQALPLLERVVRARPGVVEAAYLLAVCYSALGRPAQARLTLLSLPAQARDREEIQLLLGSAALALGRHSEAQSHFERVLQLDPDSVQGAANLGALLVARGSVGRGLELLERAWKRDSSSYLAGYNLALGYVETGNFEGARRALTTLLARQETGELYSLLGEVETRLKNPQGAVQYLARAVELEPSEAHLFDLGYRLLRLWMLNEAGEAFRRGTEQFRRSARLWMGLGSVYFAQAKTEEAIDAYLQATEAGPKPRSDDPRPYRLLASAYLASKTPRADVAARFRRYRLAHPRDAWANFFDGYCILRGGAPELALPLLRQALALDPRLAEAHFELGKIYALQEKHQEALAGYEAAVQANPNYQEVYYRLGLAYARVGRQAEAETALARHEELRREQAANNEARLRETLLAGWGLDDEGAKSKR